MRIKSKKCYDHLRTRKILPLPCPDTLNKYLHSIDSTAYGFQPAIFQCLKLKASRMELSDKRGKNDPCDSQSGSSVDQRSKKGILKRPSLSTSTSRSLAPSRPRQSYYSQFDSRQEDISKDKQGIALRNAGARDLESPLEDLSTPTSLTDSDVSSQYLSSDSSRKHKKVWRTNDLVDRVKRTRWVSSEVNREFWKQSRGISFATFTK
ncbi:hypothetical protein X777_05749 [Ooceraea biroi]|uniref:Uncharacterized protein n=1 Tax=Ooceraea biroi TaxID=2015173 RepID=A0A026WHE3_OOCBI|nr:hypothetical protein X777_05749 [Ooceraea biroi]